MGRKKAGGQPLRANISEINRLIAKFLEDVAKDFSEYNNITPQKEPIVYGFNLRPGPNGEPILESFGNSYKQNQKTYQTPKPDTEVEPLVDEIEKENELTLIMEMAGVDKKDVKIKATHNTVEITSMLHGKKASQSIRTSRSVDPGSALARFRNGILEITFNKAPYSNKSAQVKIKD